MISGGVVQVGSLYRSNRARRQGAWVAADHAHRTLVVHVDFGQTLVAARLAAEADLGC